MTKLVLVPEDQLTIDGQCVVEDMEGELVFLIHDRIEALAIVESYNNHQTLVEALEAVALFNSIEGYTARRALKEAGVP